MPARHRRQNLVHEHKHATVWDIYDVVREIGHGMTGKVYQVRQDWDGEGTGGGRAGQRRTTRVHARLTAATTNAYYPPDPQPVAHF